MGKLISRGKTIACGPHSKSATELRLEAWSLILQDSFSHQITAKPQRQFYSSAFHLLFTHGLQIEQDYYYLHSSGRQYFRPRDGFSLKTWNENLHYISQEGKVTRNANSHSEGSLHGGCREVSVTGSKHLCTLSCCRYKACQGNPFGEDSTNSNLWGTSSPATSTSPLTIQRTTSVFNI